MILLTKGSANAPEEGHRRRRLVADVADLLENGLVINGTHHFQRVYATDLSRCYLEALADPDSRAGSAVEISTEEREPARLTDELRELVRAEVVAALHELHGGSRRVPIALLAQRSGISSDHYRCAARAWGSRPRRRTEGDGRARRRRVSARQP